MQLGVIEGFYGSPWTTAERLSLFERLHAQAFSRYCYAPKSDHMLRKHWQQPWSDADVQALRALRDNAHELSVAFDLGFSPLGVAENWNASTRALLKAKIQQINRINPEKLAVLFDDMRGDVPQLAQLQAEIVDFIMQHSRAQSYLLCPSYYSLDPVLEQLFGARPTNYWQDLGRLLPSAVDIFWTGDQVISSHYAADSMASIAELLQRKPTLWDNSLANDGRKTSPFLKFAPMPVNAASLPQNIQGVYFNPMNQAAVAESVLATFHHADNLYAAFSPTLQQALQRFSLDLAEAGLFDLPALRKQQLVETFLAFDVPIARSILKWLAGDYDFDPACLT